ncbi:TadE/TadG family type IV pilus assembly protein [Rhodoblastus sp.]|uniref:TadE/TadG family type IV pilus assembly protein n=1 Tax=Rhodoblastus sp. TaxID=1962975 RepID=UPI0026233CB3|nr:TadE/TadG family type IV pilus assembly protein [Rhodoblastus sp.]
MMTKTILRSFVTRNSGAVALEFALVAFPFLATIAVICEEGLDLYMRSAIEHAATEAARAVYTGTAQNATANGAPLTRQNFIKNYVCANLPAALSCSNVFVNVKSFQESDSGGATPTPYYNFLNTGGTAISQPQLDNAKNTFCLGSTSAYVVLQVSYPMPLITNLLGTGAIASYNGQKVRVLSTTAAFRNEPFPTPANTQC